MASEKTPDPKMSSEQFSTPSAKPSNKFRYRQLDLKSSKHFYLNPKLADVHFIFGSDGDDIVRVPAHKHLLAVISDVFEKMFYGKLKEIGNVPIPDTSATVFKEFLQFFYVRNIDLSNEHIIDILYLGHKYNVSECVSACIQFLKDNVTDENVCDVLTAAIFFEHQQLTKICDAHIKMNTAAVVKSSGFLECHREVLARILMMNLLSYSEVEIFEVCMVWAQAKSGAESLTKEIVDEHLGDLFHKIPFASMTIQQFCTLAVKYDTVFRQDFHSISNMIFGSDSVPPSNQCKIQWNSTAAIIKKGPELFNNEVKLLLFVWLAIVCVIFLVLVGNLLLNIED